MKSSFAIGALIASVATAAPTALSSRQDTNIDVIVLQFALTLEHLENVFYHGVLDRFTEQDFVDAGYSKTYYNNIKYISFDEQVHVQSLTAALEAANQEPVAACTYNFPYSDVASFITLSSVLEGVGTSAYLGGAPLITSKDYLTVAGSILVTEAIHTSLQRGAIGEVPMANAYGTPLDPTSVFTLAASFIDSCPPSNVELPFVPFPALTYHAAANCTCEEPDCTPSNIIKRGHSTHSTSCSPAPSATPMTSTSHPASGHSYCSPPAAGASIKFTTASSVPHGSFVTFISGLSIVSVPAVGDGNTINVVIPSECAGQTYVFVTKSDVTGKFDDSAVLYGPAIVEVAPPAPIVDNSIV